MKEWRVGMAVGLGLLLPVEWVGGVALALPPVTEQPEEVLRAKIILDARSPIDGKPMTPTEYAELQNQLNAPLEYQTELSSNLVKTVRMLKLRKFVKKYFPFIPLK